MGGNVIEHDITCGRPSAKVMVDGEHDVLVAGAPVYAGRVPRQAAEALRAFSGNGGPAVIACVYGNRDYDDALVELQDIVDRQGFNTVAAGAFIARHCIFNDVAADRPDTDDMRKIDNFATECARLLASTPDVSALPEPTVKGNRPYKGKQGPAPVPIGRRRAVRRLPDMRTSMPRRRDTGRVAMPNRQRQVHILRTVYGNMPTPRKSVQRHALRTDCGQIRKGQRRPPRTRNILSSPRQRPNGMTPPNRTLCEMPSFTARKTAFRHAIYGLSQPDTRPFVFS